MRVPLFHDSTTDTEHALQVLWADSLRWQASSAGEAAAQEAWSRGA
jgi:hypothetical protein